MRFQLLLVGGSATDDPEGSRVLAECRERAGSDPDVHVVELPPTANLEINALQRASTVIVQKSLREGFGLTVAEALWKASGQQKIVWFDCTHYGAALYVVPGLRQVVEHFRVE